MAIFVVPALAHDPSHPELNGWFDKLASGRGLCCSLTDGVTVADPDWESRDGRYRVRLYGEWIDVPDDALITEPNRVGRTMVWPMLLNGRPGYPKHKCPLTGATTFGGVLAKVLSDESISKRVVNVSVQPSAGLASVIYDDEHAISLSFDKQHESKVKVRFSTSLAAETIHELTKAVTKLLSNEKPS